MLVVAVLVLAILFLSCLWLKGMPGVKPGRTKLIADIRRFALCDRWGERASAYAASICPSVMANLALKPQCCSARRTEFQLDQDRMSLDMSQAGFALPGNIRSSSRQHALQAFGRCRYSLGSCTALLLPTSDQGRSAVPCGCGKQRRLLALSMVTGVAAFLAVSEHISQLICLNFSFVSAR
jgi:hypothetical protein